MLVIAGAVRDLSFSKLMEVYGSGNQARAAEEYAYLPQGQAVMQVEQDLYHYLRECFFSTAGAAYCIWQEERHYLSALRLEPYRDGLLLAALETAPQYRNRGYAATLIREVQAYLNRRGSVKLYSHVGHSNAPSIAVHKACGFRRILDHAVYIDGSVSCQAGTYLYEAGTLSEKFNKS